MIDFTLTLEARMAADAIVVRKLLERWVSELEPAIVFDRQFNVLGLAPAESEVGFKPFILRPVA